MSEIITYPTTVPQYHDTQKITLDKILQEFNGNGSGPGVGGTIQVYTGAAPPATPDDPTAAAVFYPDGGGSLQQWDVVGQAWV